MTSPVWENPLLSESELAERSGFSRAWIKFALDSGRLKNVQRGRQRKVFWSDFYEYLQDTYGLDGDLRGAEDLAIKHLDKEGRR